MSARRRRRSRVAPTRAAMRAVVLVPSPTQPGLSEAERLALRLRRDANIAGACACGARFGSLRVRPGRIAHPVMRHRVDCPAGDGPTLERLAGRLGDALEYEAVVVELGAGS
jgi:hypothetical protein